MTRSRPDGSSDPTLTPSQAVDPSNDSTLVATDGDQASAHVRPPKLALSGYEIGELLGEGGMGEVLLARDARIGRDVAIKRMRHASPGDDAVARFLREAKIQARLDHPAIVPVHDLGSDSEGRPYFTMKRIPSATLHDELAREGVSRKRLLRAFVDVCLAVEFAHARGYVHRDLKPSNISLGEYGEVYVLDWGVARAIGDAAGSDPAGGPDIATLEGATQVGALLGTPGYMAPEQARGETVGTPADVYALGCMLFEILAREPLHPRGGNAAIASTLTQPVQSPAARRLDAGVPPELDAVCIAALAAEPDKRPRARELADRVQHYLDGDRDTEHRRELAAAELAAARTALATDGDRAEAIRRAGRALVLDPEAPEAATLVLKLLVERPVELPPDLERDLEAHGAELGIQTARTAAQATLGYLAFVPLMLWMGVRNWVAFGAMCAAGIVLYLHSRRAMRTGRLVPAIPLALNAFMMVLLSRLFSPFVFVPAVIAIFAATIMSQSSRWKRPAFVLAISIGSLLLPIALEMIGVLGRTWSFDHGRLVIESTVADLGGPATIVLLVVGNVAVIVVNSLFARSMAQTRDLALRQVEIQAWHLRKLLPVDAPRPVMPAEPFSCH
ncbi:MAG TPA: serine/threonine-protein kinase [Kofleriaceae bacterium]|nr:serine/threonine-protein kinase [Kofleriaceae bacterium]